MVVHDSFDAPYVIIGIGGPVIVVQGWWLFHPPRETLAPDLLGQGAAEIFLVTGPRGVGMLAPLGFIACFARGLAIVFWRMFADFLHGFGGSSGFLLGGETPVFSGFRILILPSLSRGRTGIRPLASVSPRGGTGPGRAAFPVSPRR